MGEGSKERRSSIPTLEDFMTMTKRMRATGQRRVREADSSKRAPFANSIPRSAKRKFGRRDHESQIAAHIRVSGVTLSDENRAYIRRKLGTKLGKFARSIERVTVRMKDINGPYGGVDQVCRIKVVLTGLPSVIVEKTAASPDAATDLALTSIERAVRRTMQRRRQRPIQRQLRTKAKTAA